MEKVFKQTDQWLGKFAGVFVAIAETVGHHAQRDESLRGNRFSKLQKNW